MADSATVEDRCHQKKLFVGGLGHATTTQTLRSYFRRYGAVVDAVVLRWPDGRSRGFGYITFAEAASASAALKETHKLAGSSVDVQRAVPGTNKVFVGGLPQTASAAELREYFEQFGVVSDAVVMMDPVTSRSRGFGFVCFSPGQDGGAALSMVLERYDRHYLRGKWIEVKSAAPPRKLLAMDGEASASPVSTHGEDTTPTTASSVAGADGLAHVAYGLLSAELPPAPLPGGLAPGLPSCGDLAARQFAGHELGEPAARFARAASGLPSLLATAHPSQYVNPSDRVEAKGDMPGLHDPMKVPLDGTYSGAESTAAPPPGLFDATVTGDLRRSLEELLRLQAAATWAMQAGGQW